jgi:hypothetical protein
MQQSALLFQHDIATLKGTRRDIDVMENTIVT